MYYDCTIHELTARCNDSYSVITMDPPWQYDDKALAGHRGAACKYPVMTNADLAGMPIQAIAAPDCALFMWATYPKLPDALALMAALGWTYRTKAFTWVKLSKNSPPFGTTGSRLHWGMGRWTRANDEVILLGTRGKLSRVRADIHSVIHAPIEGHSRKPVIFAERIVDLMGDLPRMELFARGDRHDGWDNWGDSPIYNDRPQQALVLPTAA